MALVGSRGTNFNLSKHKNNTLVFSTTQANSIDKHRLGVVGAISIALVAGEILGALLFPEFAPLFMVGGAIAQQSLSTYTFASRKHRSTKDDINFGITTAINVISVALPLSSYARQSKNIIKVIDKRYTANFRYIQRGERGFNTNYKALKTSQRVSAISRGKERDLMRKGLIKTRYELRTINYEKQLQKTLREANSKKVYTPAHNKDLAIFRNEMRQVSKNKITYDEAKEKIVNSVSHQLSKDIEKSENFKDNFMKSVEKYSNRFEDTTNKDRFLYKQLKFFSTKQGRNLTQFVQLANPNDLMRELFNKPTHAILDGSLDFYGKEINIFGKEFTKKGGLRGIARDYGEKSPIINNIRAIVKMPLQKRLIAKAKTIKDQLKKVKGGVVVKENRLLIGWRVIQKGEHYSNVMFYFNPIHTNAKTPGSNNYGGKKPFASFVKNKDLDTLRMSNQPAYRYLKGGGGMSKPIALSPGGRHLDFGIIESEALELLSVYLPIEALRNLFSMLSNFKQVALKLSKNTFTQTWATTLKSTASRLWVNKATRIFGHGIGNLFGAEVGAHLGRLFKTTAQGFQRTHTTTRMINGVKVKITNSYLSKDFNWKPLVKQGLPLTGKSHLLRKLGKKDKYGLTKSKIKGQRYGKTIRRPVGLFTKW